MEWMIRDAKHEIETLFFLDILFADKNVIFEALYNIFFLLLFLWANRKWKRNSAGKSQLILIMGWHKIPRRFYYNLCFALLPRVFVELCRKQLVVLSLSQCDTNCRPLMFLLSMLYNFQVAAGSFFSLGLDRKREAGNVVSFTRY